jgi:uncharacterized protein (TIGR00369 family)
MDVTYDQSCFCCGRLNEQGLKLEFGYPERGKAVSDTRVPMYFTGWRNMTHGGFLSMLLDEVMAHACVSADRLMVTAEMNTRYKKPVAVGETIHLEGRVSSLRGRIAEVAGTITDAAGDIVAEATGRFLAPPKGE